MAFIRFINEKKGVVSIEFAIVLIAMFSITFFAMDTGMYIMEKNKLERVNYSLMTLIRERTRLYGNINTLTQTEVNELERIATKLLGGSLANNIKVKVDGLYFDDINSTPTNMIIDKETSMISQKHSTLSNTECFSSLSTVSTLKNNAVWVDPKGWRPVFRVSVCVPNRNKTPFAYYRHNNNSSSVFMVSSLGMLR